MAKIKRPKYVSVEWEGQVAGCHPGNFPESEVPKVIDALKARGITKIWIDDKEMSLLQCSRCSQPVHKTWDHLKISEAGESWTCL